MSITSEEFRALMGSFASGVTIVTTVANDGRLWGLTVSAFSSLSMEPPQCLVCLDNRTGSLGAFTDSGKFAVNILGADQDHLSNHFASPQEDKFTELEYTLSPQKKCPVFSDALAWMECSVVDVFPGGDHQIFVGALEAVQVNEGRPLLYWGGSYGDFEAR